MKNLLILFLIFANAISAQSVDFNVKKGVAIEGYDVVSYFDNNPIKGKDTFSTIYKDVTFKFSSQKSLDTFKLTPDKYLPKYGGYCAYAIAVKGTKVSVNPKTYEIRNGNLYLFYNAWGTNTLKLWQKESPKKLVDKADNNWKNIESM